MRPRIEALVECGWLRWDFERAIEGHPEQRLETQLRALPASRARATALAKLKTLCEHRDEVTSAAGKSAPLQQALDRRPPTA
ncbi:MAG: hypothetical protein ACT4TC_23895 [Myxococcaceae bacterium]